jgi:hypothetical protein
MHSQAQEIGLAQRETSYFTQRYRQCQRFE